MTQLFIECSNFKYNTDTDWIQIYYNDKWENWLWAGMQWDGFLYKQGDQYIDATGGYDAYIPTGINTSIVFSDDRIDFSGTAQAGNNCSIGIQARKGINLYGKPYTKCNVRFSVTYHNSSDYRIVLRVIDAIGNVIEDNSIMVRKGVVTDEVISLVIPQPIKKQALFPSIIISYDNGRSVSGYFSEIWLSI